MAHVELLAVLEQLPSRPAEPLTTVGTEGDREPVGCVHQALVLEATTVDLADEAVVDLPRILVGGGAAFGKPRLESRQRCR